MIRSVSADRLMRALDIGPDEVLTGLRLSLDGATVEVRSEPHPSPIASAEDLLRLSQVMEKHDPSSGAIPPPAFGTEAAAWAR